MTACTRTSRLGALGFFRKGRLVGMPAKCNNRLPVLGVLPESFESGRGYPRAEVNAVLLRFHADFCRLRREFVDEGLLERSGSGSEYRKAGQ